MPMKFRYVDNHPVDLADGRPIAPGEFVFLSEEEADIPHNKSLIADGKLLPTGEKSEEVAEKAERAAAREAKKVGD